MTWNDMKDRVSEAYQGGLLKMRRDRSFPVYRPREREYTGTVTTPDGKERTNKCFCGCDYTPVYRGTKKEFQEFLTDLSLHGTVTETGICGGFDGLQYVGDPDYEPLVGE